MKTEQILQILKVAAWVIFIGLCVKTGAMLISFLVSIFVNTEGAKNLYMGMNLHELYTFSKGHYILMASLIILINASKASLFFWVIRVISKIDFRYLFNEQITSHVLNISYISLQIGIIALVAGNYAQWLKDKNIHFDFEGGATDYLFFAGILFLLAQVFKRGTEIQAENELTI